MSHLKERKEKNCLNCNAEVYGRYCHICGQENVEPKESFWGLLTHFVYDITHFDGKFFSTLKYLLLKPGFLSHQFLKGKRTSYLHPIRMYVFTSAVFFIILFSLIIKSNEMGARMASENKQVLNKQLLILKDSLKKVTDTAERRKMEYAIDKLNGLSRVAATSEPIDSASTVKAQDNTNIYTLDSGDSSLPSSIIEYDSIQNKLSREERDGWWKQVFMHRVIGINKKYKNQEELLKAFTETFRHSVPQMMFISLPLIALVLQLLYIRKRKEFFYVDHIIFLIHVYIAIFISLLLYYGFDALNNFSNFAPFRWIATIISIYIFLYCFIGMYKFYRQGIIKTFFKYLILLIVAALLTGILALIFVLTSFFQM